ncbi:hypothetical protein RJT34_18481 [Clitoria ternatea]|uniref:BED-type domain-containing protein n=1 Tax=Clitoria ternatea TaxID=43366 RepID=A0AAN9JC70_CLITE
MGRRKDEKYWNKVTKDENGTLTCKRCGHRFKSGLFRIKAHVDRLQGQGVAVCPIHHPHDSLNSTSDHSQQHPLQGSTEVASAQETVDAVGSINNQNNTESTQGTYPS